MGDGDWWIDLAMKWGTSPWMSQRHYLHLVFYEQASSRTL